MKGNPLDFVSASISASLLKIIIPRSLFLNMDLFTYSILADLGRIRSKLRDVVNSFYFRVNNNDEFGRKS